MPSVIVVVTDVFSDQAFQMPFTYNDHMIQQIPAAAADPTLGNTILPRTSEAGSHGLNAEALHCFDHFATEVCTAIKDQVSGGSIEWECLAQLLNDPSAGWMLVALQWTICRRLCAMTKKQYSTPRVSVGTVKKSIAVMASRWMFRNALHRFAGSELRGCVVKGRTAILLTQFRSDTTTSDVLAL